MLACSKDSLVVVVTVEDHLTVQPTSHSQLSAKKILVYNEQDEYELSLLRSPLSSRLIRIIVQSVIRI